ncbi:MAG TPA: nucleotide pyrophosphohydrolase [Dokdonella sp.]|uniref:nucleotide pyrophosphohydrolase n=1 Tax=Dokdonella sp. TaxID=2291710 RepID=UPI002D7E9D5A|nr:nucleotide pyrophosphohydrolase [Dokdonella sp.]HET9031594.1 nucleotide pyrophosphohydrolase [Dokdonella sp.]
MISPNLVQRLLDFRAERDWEQFHNLRTLSTSIVLETAELAEFTQWASDSEIAEIARSRRAEIAHEIADIAILLSYLSHDLSIDLEMAVSEKLQLNAVRYPVAKSKGTVKKYDQLE